MERSFNGDEVGRIRFQASLLEAAGQAVVATDLPGEIVYWNSAAERIYGWTSEEAVGRPAREVIVSGDIFEQNGGIMARLLDGEVWHGEVTVRNRYGAPLDLLASNAPVYGGEGELIGVVSVQADITERKRMEEALRESEKKFRTQYQGFPIPTISWRRVRDDFVLIDYNDAAHETTKGRIARLLGQRASETYRDEPEMLDLLRRSYRERTNFTEEMWRTSEYNAEPRCQTVTFVFVPPNLVMLHAEDITDRKRAEDGLRESEERFRQLHDATFEGIFIHDGEKILEANEALAAMSGYEKEDLVGSPGLSFVTPESRAFVGRHVREGSGEPYEVVGIRKDGAHLDLEVRGREFAYRGRPARMVSVRDVTRRKRMEQALHESREFMSSILENAPTPIYIVTDENRMRLVNGAYEDLFGVRREAIIGAFVDDVFPPEMARRFGEINRQVIDTGSPMVVEFPVDTPAGRRDLQVAKFPLRDPEGRIEAVGGIAVDVTERRRAERALRQSEKLARSQLAELQTIYGTAPIGLAFMDREMRFVKVNEELAEFDGFSVEEHIGKTLRELLPVELADPVEQMYRRVFETGEPVTEQDLRGETRVRPGEIQDWLVSLHPVKDAAGEVLGINVLVQNTTERKRAEEEIRESEERFRTLTDAALEALVISERIGDGAGGERVRILGVNRAFTEVFGYEAEEFFGKGAPDLIAPGSLGVVERNISSGYTGIYEAVGMKKDGARLDLEIRGKTATYRGRRVRVSALRDITGRKQMEGALRRSEEEYRELFEHHPQPMWVYDTGTLEFLAVNEAAIRRYGYSREEFLSMTISDIRPGRDEDRVREVARIVSEGQRYSGEWRHRNKEGMAFDVEITSHGIVFDGRHARLVQAADITERKLLEEQLAHQAFHDSLTGLPNRALFADRLEHALAGIRRSESFVAVLFADLDNFKSINDGFGHDTGDQLLVAVAERLKSCLRPEDTLARFGGDEFVILLEGVESPDGVIRVANRVSEELREPFGLSGREVFVSASIGISLEDSDEALPEIVLRNADTAMYQAKGHDGISYEVFEPGMYARVLRRLELENELRRGLEQRQFKVHYQPQVDLRSGKIVGMEALVRWENPGRGLIMPAEFIPLAEETGMIVPLGRWVLREACRQAQAWRSERREAGRLEIGVNLSLRQFQDPGLVQEVADALRLSNLDPRCLMLEITESVAMEDAELTITVLQELKKLGVQLAVDDFGTGHSSLTYLIKRFQMDVLKIDRSFVAELTRDSDYETIVSGITGIARDLNLRVIAEGIETAEQLDHVRNIGCSTGQGFFFSWPAPTEEAAALLRSDVRW